VSVLSSLIPQTFTEPLICARHWRHRNEDRLPALKELPAQCREAESVTGNSDLHHGLVQVSFPPWGMPSLKQLIDATQWVLWNDWISQGHVTSQIWGWEAFQSNRGVEAWRVRREPVKGRVTSQIGHSWPLPQHCEALQCQPLMKSSFCPHGAYQWALYVIGANLLQMKELNILLYKKEDKTQLSIVDMWSCGHSSPSASSQWCGSQWGRPQSARCDPKAPSVLCVELANRLTQPTCCGPCPHMSHYPNNDNRFFAVRGHAHR
jgi:hypothetical protein